MVYLAINSKSLKVSCRSQNVIYSLSSNHCNQQYVGETTTKLSLRMNTHRTSVTGCEHVIHHKQNCESNVFAIPILEKFKGDGYGDDNKPDPAVTKLRQDREDFWIKLLRTLYPYGLNEKAFDKLSSSSQPQNAIGRFYPQLERCKIRPKGKRFRDRASNDITSAKDFYLKINMWYKDDIKNTFNKIRLTLNQLSKKILKFIASEI